MPPRPAVVDAVDATPLHLPTSNHRRRSIPCHLEPTAYSNPFRQAQASQDSASMEGTTRMAPPPPNPRRILDFRPGRGSGVDRRDLDCASKEENRHRKTLPLPGQPTKVSSGPNPTLPTSVCSGSGNLEPPSTGTYREESAIGEVQPSRSFDEEGLLRAHHPAPHPRRGAESRARAAAPRSQPAGLARSSDKGGRHLAKACRRGADSTDAARRAEADAPLAGARRARSFLAAPALRSAT